MQCGGTMHCGGTMQCGVSSVVLAVWWYHAVWC